MNKRKAGRPRRDKRTANPMSGTTLSDALGLGPLSSSWKAVILPGRESRVRGGDGKVKVVTGKTLADLVRKLAKQSLIARGCPKSAASEVLRVVLPRGRAGQAGV